MFMHCGVILIVRVFFYFYINNNYNDICLRFLPPSSTGTIAHVHVSTYVGGVHKDLTSLSPNPGDASEVADGRPIGAAHAGPYSSPCLRGGPLQEGGAATRGPPNESRPRMSGPCPRRRKGKKEERIIAPICSSE